MVPVSTSTAVAPGAMPSSAVRAVLANLMGWASVAAVHAFAVWSDALRRGRTPDLLAMFGDYAIAYAPWVPFGAALYVLHRRSRSDWRSAFLVSFAFLMFELVYQAALVATDTGLTVAAVIAGVRDMPMIFRLIDVALVLTTNAIVYAVVAIRSQREATEHAHRLQSANLRLSLELERQRLQGLRAQLEPHFLYNALNAISGLVRNSDRTLALTALQHLSRLLRYATTTVSRDWVPLSDEVGFLQEYLALQQLRFGNRLEVIYEGLEGLPADQESLPLLLQPLAENAIRHGLERSEAATTILIRLSVDVDSTTILVSNTVAGDAPPNPGLGVGLHTLRDRLAVAYGGRATLTTVADPHHFRATLLLPHASDD